MRFKRVIMVIMVFSLLSFVSENLEFLFVLNHCKYNSTYLGFDNPFFHTGLSFIATSFIISEKFLGEDVRVFSFPCQLPEPCPVGTVSLRIILKRMVLFIT